MNRNICKSKANILSVQLEINLDIFALLFVFCLNLCAERSVLLTHKNYKGFFTITSIHL